ncbi:MAG: hypothetical protein IJ265_00435 [Oscillospiraceae bacterium]|nr:hypothetical protein [Oscillospiraceae bacterium]
MTNSIMDERTTKVAVSRLRGRKMSAQLKAEEMTFKLQDVFFADQNLSSKMNKDMEAIEAFLYNCIYDYRSWRKKSDAGKTLDSRLTELQGKLTYARIPDDAGDLLLCFLEEYYDDDKFLKQIEARFGFWSALKRFLITHGDPDAPTQDKKKDRAKGALQHAKGNYHALDDRSAKEMYTAMMKKLEIPKPTSEKGELYKVGGVVNNWLNNAEKVSREIVLRSAFGLQLDDAEAKELLRSGQCDPFDPTDLYDSVIRYGLRQGMTLMETTALYERIFLEFLQRLHELPDWRGFGTYQENMTFSDYYHAEQQILNILSLDESKFVQALMPLIRISKEKMVEALSLTSQLSNADAYTSALSAYTASLETGEETREIVDTIVSVLTECRVKGANEKKTTSALNSKLESYVSYLEYKRQALMQKPLQEQLNMLKNSVDEIRVIMVSDVMAYEVDKQIRKVRESVHYQQHPKDTDKSRNAVDRLEQRVAKLMAYLVDGAKVEQRDIGENPFTAERILSLLNGEKLVERSDLLRLAYFDTLMEYYLVRDHGNVAEESAAYFEKKANELLRNAVYPELYVRSPLDCLMIHSLCQGEECVRVYQKLMPNQMESEE